MNTEDQEQIEATAPSKPVGIRISETKKRVDEVALLKKKRDAEIAAMPISLQIQNELLDIEQEKEFLLKYLKDNSIPSMAGVDGGKIKINATDQISVTSWTECYKYISLRLLKNLGVSDEEAVFMVVNCDPLKLQEPFTLLKKTINSDTYKVLKEAQEVPAFLRVFVQEKLILTK
jgi:hypothetical protein